MVRYFDLFDELMTLAQPNWTKTPWRENVTIDREPDRYIVRAIVPGFEESELNVTTRGNTLCLSGKQEKKSDFLSENSNFERNFTLPSDIQIDSISAEYRAGILTITLPKRKAVVAEMKNVPIKALGPPK